MVAQQNEVKPWSGYCQCNAALATASTQAGWHSTIPASDNHGYFSITAPTSSAVHSATKTGSHSNFPMPSSSAATTASGSSILPFSR